MDVGHRCLHVIILSSFPIEGIYIRFNILSVIRIDISKRKKSKKKKKIEFQFRVKHFLVNPSIKLLPINVMCAR